MFQGHKPRKKMDMAQKWCTQELFGKRKNDQKLCDDPCTLLWGKGDETALEDGECPQLTDLLGNWFLKVIFLEGAHKTFGPLWLEIMALHNDYNFWESALEIQTDSGR